MDLNPLVKFINSTGFPIFVAVVLLMRVDAMHEANLKAIEELTIEFRLLRAALQREEH